MAERCTLSVRDGHQRQLDVFAVHGGEARNVQPVMKRSHVRHALAPHVREMQIIQVEVDDIELRSIPEHLLQHDQMADEHICSIGAEPESSRDGWPEIGTGPGVAACKQRYLMFLAQQL